MKIKSLLLFSTVIILNLHSIEAQEIQITPRPQKIITGKKTFIISADTQLVFDNDSEKSTNNLQQYFKSDFGLDLKKTNYQSLKTNFISFQIDESLTDEGY